jgi:manganese/zinc/iron transport system permease protein
MWQFFSDPVLFAPSLGCSFVCLLAAICGSFTVLKRQSLVGETLSHASYPGVIIALASSFYYFSEGSLWISFIGASLSCYCGLWLVGVLQRKAHVYPDAALCFVLSSFFGVGILLLSLLQNPYPTLYRQLQSYLFGQAATMNDSQVQGIGIVLLVFFLIIGCFFKEIKAVLFDEEFAQVSGLPLAKIQRLLEMMCVIAVVLAIRAVGVVLMSSMLVFPVVTARQWSDRLRTILILSALLGLCSGFFGVYFSHTLSITQGLVFPTGPTTLLFASALFFLSSLVSPKSGLFVRLLRQKKFHLQCKLENFLKMLSKSRRGSFSKKEASSFLRFMLLQRGWIRKGERGFFELTPSGLLWGRKIVRLHRLWELYLVQYCGLAADRVHPSAEEMEHCITPEIEESLLTMLHYPKYDPHQQPIPM